MVERHRCLPCRSTKRKKMVADLHSKTNTLIAKADNLTSMWDELGKELMFDTELEEEAIMPFHHLQLATKLLRKIYEDGDDQQET